MPTRAVTIGIKDQAQRRIAEAAAVLAERFGVEFAPAKPDGRDRDYIAAMELDAIARFLGRIVEAVDALGLHQLPPPPVDLTATVPMTRAELEEAAAQLGITGAKSMPNKQTLIDAINAREAELLATSDPDAIPEIP